MRPKFEVLRYTTSAFL